MQLLQRYEEVRRTRAHEEGLHDAAVSRCKYPVHAFTPCVCVYSMLTIVSPRLQPGLPNSAVCVLCGEGQGKQELVDASPSSTTLMECSNCAQIAHPDCIKVTRPRTSTWIYLYYSVH